MNNQINQSQLQEVLKALGFGNITTDVANFTQGGALVTESLDTVVKEMTLSDDAYPLLDSLPVETVGNELFQWVDRTSVGHSEFATVTDRYAGTTEANSTFNRRNFRIAYQATAFGTYDTLTEQQNALPEVNQEDVAAIKRIKADQSIMIWEGNPNVASNQMAGFAYWVENWGVAAQIADLGDTAIYSGLDANGFSNPGDIEKAVKKLGQYVYQPTLGHGRLTDLTVAPSVATDLDIYKNFTAFVEYTGQTTERITGHILGGFTNRFAGPNRTTLLGSDQWIRDGEKLKPQSARGMVTTATNQPASVTPTTSAASGAEATRWNAAFAGTYVYMVCGIDVNGIESTPLAVTGVVTNTSTATKVSLAIVKSAGDAETGYAIYRSFPGAANDDDNVRLVARVAKAAGGTTTFVDLNKRFPGAVDSYGWNNAVPGFVELKRTVDFRKLELPRSIAALAKRPFGAFTSLQMVMPFYKHGTLIRNYVPQNGGWSPLTGNH